MSITHVTALRNTLADDVDYAINTGAGTAKLRILQGGTTIVDINLQNPAFGDSAIGVITLNGVPLNADATADGVADTVQLLNRDGAVRVTGTVTITGGGGDLELDNTDIAAPQRVNLNSLTYEAAV